LLRRAARRPSAAGGGRVSAGLRRSLRPLSLPGLGRALSGRRTAASRRIRAAARCRRTRRVRCTCPRRSRRAREPNARETARTWNHGHYGHSRTTRGTTSAWRCGSAGRSTLARRRGSAGRTTFGRGCRSTGRRTACGLAARGLGAARRLPTRGWAGGWLPAGRRGRSATARLTGSRSAAWLTRCGLARGLRPRL